MTEHVVPEGWKVVVIDNVAKRCSGHTPNKKHPEYWDGAIKWVSLKDSDKLDKFFINDTEASITEEGIRNSSAVLLPAGTVIISRDAGVGKSAILAEPMAVSQHFMAWICGEKIHNYFLYYWLQVNKRRFELIAVGSTIKTIGLPYFKKLKVTLPPLPEQRRIVAVLETWDKAIDLLKRKIAVKRQIKKGLMERLLTGKVRLTGYTGEWHNHEIGEVLRYEQPQRYIVESDQYDDANKTPVLTAGKSFILGYTNETSGICDDLPVIIFDDFTTTNKFVDFVFKVKSSAMKLLRSNDKKQFNLRFIYERIQLINFTVGEHKRKYLSEYQYLSIKLPDIEEQNAIASILTTADQEIEALQKKLQLLQQQKQYLLNNLVTGNIRTPENLSVSEV